jgi:anti-anti-sigma factor
MTIRRTLADGAVVLSVAGSIVGNDFGDLHRELVGHLRARRTRIVLDFRGVEHVSYHHASMLAREFDLVRSYAGDMSIHGVTPYVRDILVLAGLSEVLEAHGSDAGGARRPGQGLAGHRAC